MARNQILNMPRPWFCRTTSWGFNCKRNLWLTVTPRPQVCVITAIFGKFVLFKKYFLKKTSVIWRNFFDRLIKVRQEKEIDKETKELLSFTKENYSSKYDLVLTVKKLPFFQILNKFRVFESFWAKLSDIFSYIFLSSCLNNTQSPLENWLLPFAQDCTHSRHEMTWL